MLMGKVRNMERGLSLCPANINIKVISKTVNGVGLAQ